MKMLIVMFLLILSVPAAAQTVVGPAPGGTIQPDERKAVAFLLSAAHELPPRSDFDAAARDPQAVLSAIAAGRGPIAERAVEALFMWPNDRTFAIATAQLADPKTKNGRRHRLMLWTAQAFGDRATPHVAAFLAADDAQLRLTAAAAIAKIRTPEAFAQLDAAVAAERDDAVKKQMQRYARRILD